MIKEELHIPNPLTRNHMFYNQLLLELYRLSYKMMSPVQFNSFVLSQRKVRWHLLQSMETIEKTFTDLLHNGKNVNAINVRKYQRAGLFNLNHEMKLWTANELEFYDFLQKKCTTMEQ